MTKTAKRRRKKRRGSTLDGRERYTTTLLPDARAALEAESLRVHETERRSNMVIESLVREHLPRTT